jgi:hypothetical protein
VLIFAAILAPCPAGKDAVLFAFFQKALLRLEVLRAERQAGPCLVQSEDLWLSGWVESEWWVVDVGRNADWRVGRWGLLASRVVLYSLRYRI